MDHQHPVAYESRKLTAAEWNYPAHVLELRALRHYPPPRPAGCLALGRRRRPRDTDRRTRRGESTGALLTPRPRRSRPAVLAAVRARWAKPRRAAAAAFANVRKRGAIPPTHPPLGGQIPPGAGMFIALAFR